MPTLRPFAALAVASLASISAGQAPTMSVRTVASGDGVVVTAASVSAPGPFFRSEAIEFETTGLLPFAPVTILLEICLAACPAVPPTPPGVSGTLGVAPAGAFFLDGLGVFGAPNPAIRGDASGALRFTAWIPPDFVQAFNPVTFRVQAVTPALPTPGAPSLAPFVLTPVVTFTVDQPPPLVPAAAVSPSFFVEGAPVEVTLTGAGAFLLRGTALPAVRFTATNGGATAAATNVRIVVEGGVPVLKATTPAFVGAPTSPPITSAGRLDVTVDYGATGLYPATPATGAATTAATSEADPAYFVMQAFTPQATLAAMVPQAGPVTGTLGATATGSLFLRGSTLTFDAGGAAPVDVVPACSPTAGAGCVAVSGSQLLVDVPPHGAGLVAVRVRGPDHLSISPRESFFTTPSGGFAYFDAGALNVLVTGTTPSAFDETAGGVQVQVFGTCAEQGGFAALHPNAGPTGLRLGYVVDGIEGSIVVPATSIATPDPATPGVPGSFRITTTVPGLPPGLNPFGFTGALGTGLTNAGVKHFQIVPPAQYGQGVHLPLAAIAAAEPANRVVYRGPAPTFLAVEPNNVGRVDGGQTITVKGSNFFTQRTSLAAATAGSTTQVVFGGLLGGLAGGFVQIVDEQTLVITTPDFSPAGAALPATADVVLVNVDGTASVPAPNFAALDADPDNDFHLVPSLALAGAPPAFGVGGASVTLDTTPGGLPQVFFFPRSLTLPAGFTLKAHGAAPLVVRVRGDLVVDGDVDLRGVAYAGVGSGAPAAAGAGGAAADLLQLGAEDPTKGRDGASPFLAPGAIPWGFGVGGLHDAVGGGGGGGAMAAAGGGGLG
ncbi:MAG TPA: IPT/TIG domain-containing protein, partial [Planctomycetota bacterium]|nr:IPT/TIG domain-containing protein [Planctomycetota bacterium]